jgi:hypothetical protein
MKWRLLSVSMSVGICVNLSSACKSNLKEDSLELAASGPIAIYEANKPRKCEPSKATLFKNSKAEILKPITIKGEVKEIFLKANGHYAVIMNPNADTDAMKFIPVFIEKRGNSRADYCEMKPARIKFMLQPSSAELKAKLAKRKDNWQTIGVSPEEHSKLIELLPKGASNEQKLQAYYEEFISLRKGGAAPEEGFPQEKISFFGQMGDDVKLVTHCGKGEVEELGGPDYKTQREHLLNEFYIYRILNDFKTTFIKTSLLDITYEQPSLGEKMSFEGNTNVVGFLRESKSRLADRCSLNVEGKTKGHNMVSVQQNHFMSNLIASKDYQLNGHNSEILFDSEGKAVYSTYDFDLSGIWGEIFVKNPGTIEDNAKRFSEFLGQKADNITILSQSLFVIGQIKKIRSKIEDAEKVINPKAAKDKQKFVRWINAYEPVLVDFINKNRVNHSEFIDAVEAYQKVNQAKESAFDPEG